MITSAIWMAWKGVRPGSGSRSGCGKGGGTGGAAAALLDLPKGFLLGLG